MGHPSRFGRDVNGIILLDKPMGLSSNALLQKVKKLFRANKAGHTGSLDVLATGMLPICLGEATKFSQYLLNADKRYLVTAQLGKRTDTSDAEGKIISIRPVSLLHHERLNKALDHFRGESSQVPSMFSALKYQGHPLYKYARRGITVARKARSICVYNLRLCERNLTHLKLEVHCSKGTYIRTIIDDLGEFIGCGAHVTALRRLTVSHYPTEKIVTPATLQAIHDDSIRVEVALMQLDALLLPLDSAVMNMPAVNVSTETAVQIRLGKTVEVTTTSPREGLVRLTSGFSSHFFGVGEIVAPGRLIPRRLISEQRA